MESENAVSALDISDLDVSYPGREVLKSVSLTVAPGEFCALIGPNGAGKTTLLRAILGAIPSRSRRITSMGAPLQPRAVGYVPQRHEFAWDFPITIRQAVLSALAPRIGWGRRARLDDHRAVEEALHQVGLAQLGEHGVRNCHDDPRHSWRNRCVRSAFLTEFDGYCLWKTGGYSRSSGVDAYL